MCVPRSLVCIRIAVQVTALVGCSVRYESVTYVPDWPSVSSITLAHPNDLGVTHCGYAGIAGVAVRVVHAGFDSDTTARLVRRDDGLAFRKGQFRIAGAITARDIADQIPGTKIMGDPAIHHCGGAACWSIRDKALKPVNLHTTGLVRLVGHRDYSG